MTRSHKSSTQRARRRRRIWLALSTLSSSAKTTSCRRALASGSAPSATTPSSSILSQSITVCPSAQLRATLMGSGQIRSSSLHALVCCDEVGGVWNQTQSAKQSVVFSRLCQGTFIECRRRQNALGEFQGAWPGLTSANLISFVRIEAHTTERRKPNDPNENAKCPDHSFRRRCHASVGSGSQQAWIRRPLRLDSQSGLRGAYDQLNGPSYAATPTRGHWNPENSGNSERDPLITGGYDTTRRPSSS